MSGYYPEGVTAKDFDVAEPEECHRCSGTGFESDDDERDGLCCSGCKGSGLIFLD